MTPLRTKQAVEKFAPLKTINNQNPDSNGNVNINEYVHPNSGVSAGIYNTVTVNEQGHITAGKNGSYVNHSNTYDDNADLNSYTTQGIFCVRNSNGANEKSWEGIQGTNGFLEVFVANEINVVKQVFRRIGTAGKNDHMTFTRKKETDGNWSIWKRIDSGGPSSLGTTGYYRNADGLVFAWAKSLTTTGTNGVIKVTKPIPFISLVALTVDRLTKQYESSQNGNNIAWSYESSTNTTDTFCTKSETGAFSVFWIGKTIE